MDYYIWHDEGCCDNKTKDLAEARRIQAWLIAEGHSDVYIADADHRVIEATYVEMPCADEGMTPRIFAPTGKTANGVPDFACLHCGWQQTSAAAGAAELCLNATWHDPAEYQRYVEVARAGGFVV